MKHIRDTNIKLSLVGLLAFVGLAACSTAQPTGLPSASSGSPSTSSTSSACAPNGTSLTQIAKGLMYQDPCLAAPANEPFTIEFHNEDAGVQHNIAIFTADPLADPSAKVVFRGQIVTGIATTTYRVGALSAGTYYFHCDVHPTTMKGMLIVK